jgi:hypothetical protein
VQGTAKGHHSWVRSLNAARDALSGDDGT